MVNNYIHLKILSILKTKITFKYNHAIKEFITKENINNIIKKYTEVDIGILSIDIDGNDYWIWNEMK